MLELAQTSDWAAVNALAHQVHDLHVSWRPDIYQKADYLYSVDRFASAIQNRELYVAKLEGQVVGFTLLPIRIVEQSGLVSRKIMLINEFCVDEFCRNQGIGKAMMADVHALARAFRCTDIQIDVYPQNDEAVSFCQKCGLTIQNIVMRAKI